MRGGEPGSTRILAPGAVHVLIGGPKGGWIQPIPVLLKMKLLAVAFDFEAANDVAKVNFDDLEILSGWLESGEVRPVIDRNYKLDEVVDALTYQGEFHTQGKVVITMTSENRGGI